MVKRMGVASMKGSMACFSRLYRPGATKAQSCVAMMGKAMRLAANSATLISTKKAS